MIRKVLQFILAVAFLGVMMEGFAQEDVRNPEWFKGVPLHVVSVDGSIEAARTSVTDVEPEGYWQGLKFRNPCKKLLISTVSYHFNVKGANDMSFGAACMFHNNVIAGAYYNSEYRVSALVGYHWDLTQYWGPLPYDIRYGITPALVTGYEGKPVKFGAMLNFTKKINDKWDVMVNFGGVVNLMFGYNF